MILGIVVVWLLFLAFLFLEPRQICLGYSFIFASLTSLVLLLVQVNSGGGNWLIYLLLAPMLLVVFVGLIFGPFLLLVTLFYNSWQLLRREGTRWYNFLSLGLAIALLVYLSYFPRLGDLLQTPNLWYYLYLLVGIWVLYFFLLSLAYSLSALFNFGHPVRQKLDYVVVLGAGLLGDKVTPLLAARIDKGIAVYKQQPGSKLIMSGGQGPDEVVSEARAMANYALEQGVSAADLILEDQSTNTQENLAFSVKLMQGAQRFALVTNHYHLFRALLFARKAGVKCIGYGAKTKFYFSLNAFIREFIGYVTISWRGHLACLGGLSLLYLSLVAWVLLT